MLRKIFAVCTILAFVAGAANAALLAEYTFGINGLNNTGTAGSAADGTALGAWAATADDGSATANAANGTGWASGMNVGGSAGGWLNQIADQLTVSLWSTMDFTVGGGGNFSTLISTGKIELNNDGGFHLGRYKTEQTIAFCVPGVTSGWNGLKITSTALPTDGGWHHYAATLDGSTVTIYIDGVAIGSAAASGNVDLGARDLLVGQSPTVFYGDGASWHSKAYSDDVLVYNEGLGAAAILAQFEAGRSVLVPEPTTIALLGLGVLGLIRRKRA